jgi:hypothetical protein
MFLKRRNDGLRWNDGGSADNKVRPFRLSGEIVEVRDRPCLDRLVLMSLCLCVCLRSCLVCLLG